MPKKFNLLLILIFLNLACGADLSNKRHPNEYEIFYQFAALELNEPDLCEKISDHVYLTAAWSRPGYQISLVKSDCYKHIAEKYAREELCKKVIPIKGISIFSDGSKISSSECINNIQKSGPDNSISTYYPSESSLLSIFQEMGYRPEDLHEKGATTSIINYVTAYEDLKKQDDIISRIEELTSHNDATSGILSLEFTEFLYDLAANVSGDISWCKKIRETVFYPPNRYSPQGGRHLFRDWCIFQVANNFKNLQACEEIPETSEQRKLASTLKDSCLRQANPLFQQSYYGYIVPQKDEDIKTILNALKVPLPTIDEIPDWQKFDRYLDFMEGLRNNHSSARQELIKKIKALP